MILLIRCFPTLLDFLNKKYFLLYTIYVSGYCKKCDIIMLSFKVTQNGLLFSYYLTNKEIFRATLSSLFPTRLLLLPDTCGFSTWREIPLWLVKCKFAWDACHKVSPIERLLCGDVICCWAWLQSAGTPPLWCWFMGLAVFFFCQKWMREEIWSSRIAYRPAVQWTIFMFDVFGLEWSVTHSCF